MPKTSWHDSSSKRRAAGLAASSSSKAARGPSALMPGPWWISTLLVVVNHYRLVHARRSRRAFAFVGGGQPDFEYLTRPDKIYFKVPIPRRAMNQNPPATSDKRSKKILVCLCYPAWPNLMPCHGAQPSCIFALCDLLNASSANRGITLRFRQLRLYAFRVDH